MKKWMLPVVIVGVALLAIVALWRRSATSSEGGGVTKLFDKQPSPSATEPAALARAETKELAPTALISASRSSASTAPVEVSATASPPAVTVSAPAATASAPTAVASAPAAVASAATAAAKARVAPSVEAERMTEYERLRQANARATLNSTAVASASAPASESARASESATRAAAAPAARTISSEDAIRLTLATFTAAFRSQDVAAVQRVFPSASADDLKQTFDKLLSLDRRLEVLSVQMGADSQFAIVRAKIEDVARLKTGATERTTTMARFVMANNSSSWIIQGAEFEAVKK